jgi:hypothetical protein
MNSHGCRTVLWLNTGLAPVDGGAAWRPYPREGGTGSDFCYRNEAAGFGVNMRQAKPHELKTRAVPAMTARISETELLKWVPVQFEEITDPWATPEPSKGALIKLDAGDYVVLYYGKISGQLIVEIPENTSDSSALLADFFNEVPLPKSRILWHRPDVKLSMRGRGRLKDALKQRSVATKSKRSARRVSLPSKSK